MRAIITVGVSCSGKSTFADWMCNGSLDHWDEHWVEINRDTIRFTQVKPGGDWNTYKFNKANERKVTELALSKFKWAADNKKNIIISDTNLNASTRQGWIDRLEDAGYQVEIKEFEVTFEEAIKRDRKRHNGVGHAVIWKQLQKWDEYKGRRIYIPDESKPSAILCDIDGTVADHEGIRSPFDWSKVGKDKLRTEIADMVKGYANADRCPLGKPIVFLSGRDGSCYKETMEWLEDHFYEQEFVLFMREAGDTRKDYIIKEELFWKHVEPNWNIKAVFDDRPQVVRLWHRLKLTNVICVGDPWNEF